MHQVDWGWLIVAAQTLSGIAAGAFLVSGALYLFGKKKEYEPIAKTTVLAISAPFSVAALIFLTIDLGRPERAANAMLNVTQLGGTSIMSLSVFLLGAFAAIEVVAALTWLIQVSQAIRRYVEIVGLVFAVPAGLQAGLLLQAATQRHFWESPVFPYLYLVTAVLSGIGAVGIIMMRKGFGSYRDSLHFMVSVSPLLIALLAVALVAHVGLVVSDAAVEVTALVAGAYPLFAPTFYVGVLFLGMVLPGFYGYQALKSGSITETAARNIFILLIIGNLALRINFLWVGQAI